MSTYEHLMICLKPSLCTRRWTPVQDHIQWPDCYQQNCSRYWKADISRKGGFYM